MKTLKKILFLCVLVSFVACNDFFSFLVEEDVVLQYKDYQLDENEMKILFRNAHNPADSVLVLERYKREWLKRKMLRHEAEKIFDIDDEEMKLKQEVYSDNMMAFSLRDHYVDSRLDTIVNNDELNQKIREYILKNSANKNLNQFSFKLRYVVVHQYAHEIDTLFNRFKNLNERNDFRFVKDYASTHTKTYALHAKWYSYRKLRRLFPEEIREGLLAKAIVKFDDKSPVLIDKHEEQYYLLYIDQIIDKNSSNMKMSYSQLIGLKNEIISKRRQKLIEQFEQNIDKKVDSILN